MKDTKMYSPNSSEYSKQGGNVQMKGWGRGKTIFFVFFLKKKFVFCLDVMRILYLCI